MGDGADFCFAVDEEGVEEESVTLLRSPAESEGEGKDLRLAEKDRINIKNFIFGAEPTIKPACPYCAFDSHLKVNERQKVTKILDPYLPTRCTVQRARCSW